MSNENPTDPKTQLPSRWLPWLLGAAMLVVYIITLNRWVTLANLPSVARVSGFNWQPELYNPLIFLVTLPLRLLPAAAIPLALNLLAAVCAGLSLALLARSVMILPHDRTATQRMRERNEFGLFTGRVAWFPPVLAVVMFGLQFGFWQNATNFTGEMLNLLIFSFIIWLLLEYRLDERPGRLPLAALIYGAGMTDNWALVGFLPVFIAAVIWLKGFEFFNIRFLTRMIFCGLVGVLFLLVLPVVGKFSSGTSWNFWEMLRPPLQMDWAVIMAVSNSVVRHNLLLMAATTLLPVLVMSIRWSRTFGDSSRTGTVLADNMFHLIHAVIFIVCMWVMFDPPFSPGQLSMGSPALTFYYLSALAIGYYSGYFLLVFGKKIMPSRRNPRPETVLPGALNLLTPVIYWGTYAGAVVLAGTLAYKNLPLIRAGNDDTLKQYAELAAQSLPKDGGILLSDSKSTLPGTQQMRTLLMQAELARSGRAKDFLVVDTQSLGWTPYHRYLHQKAPQKWPAVADDKNMGEVKPLSILTTLNLLSKSNTICYLNPSFGYYFELFYQEPHGLIYQLKTLPETTLLPPPLSTNLIAENQNLWAQAVRQEFPRIEKAIAPAQEASRLNFADWLLVHLHGRTESNPNALFVADLYSRSLDFWGVQLQRAGQLPAAADCFVNAKKINPDNIIADINLKFNETLQAGDAITVDPKRVMSDPSGIIQNWNDALTANGPVDDPSFLFVNSVLIAKSGLRRQAVAPLDRVRLLAPDYLPARLSLAQLYLFNRLPDLALETLQDPLARPSRFGLNETNSADLNILASAAHFQKNEVSQGMNLLDLEISRHPDNNTLLTVAAQAYFMHGLYTNALRLIDHQLAKMPDDPQWLFGQGYANLQLGHYDRAITALTRVLEISTNNNPTARFNRALAYLKSDRLDDAHADYIALQSTYTNSFQVAYGLAEVAWHRHDTNEAVHDYELYLANAPTNSAEIKTVRERLEQLQKK